MWKHAGLFRDEHKLRTALAMLDGMHSDLEGCLTEGCADSATLRTANLATVARLIASAALRRTESRGAHYRTDYPNHDDVHWKKRIAVVRGP